MLVGAFGFHEIQHTRSESSYFNCTLPGNVDTVDSNQLRQHCVRMGGMLLAGLHRLTRWGSSSVENCNICTICRHLRTVEGIAWRFRENSRALRKASVPGHHVLAPRIRSFPRAKETGVPDRETPQPGCVLRLSNCSGNKCPAAEIYPSPSVRERCVEPMIIPASREPRRALHCYYNETRINTNRRYT